MIDLFLSLPTDIVLGCVAAGLILVLIPALLTLFGD